MRPRLLALVIAMVLAAGVARADKTVASELGSLRRHHLGLFLAYQRGAGARLVRHTRLALSVAAITATSYALTFGGIYTMASSAHRRLGALAWATGWLVSIGGAFALRPLLRDVSEAGRRALAREVLRREARAPGFMARLSPPTIEEVRRLAEAPSP